MTDLEVRSAREKTWTLAATGVRAAEGGPIRIMALRKYGPITLSKKKWHRSVTGRRPRGRRDCQGRSEALGRVPVDEAVVRRHPRRLSGADQENRARGLQAILEWFPFVEAEV